MRPFKWSFDWTFLKQLIRDWKVFTVESWLSDAFANFDIIALSAFRGEYAVGLTARRTELSAWDRSSLPATRPHRSPTCRSYSRRSKEKFAGLESSIKYMMALVPR